MNEWNRLASFALGFVVAAVITLIVLIAFG